MNPYEFPELWVIKKKTHPKNCDMVWFWRNLVWNTHCILQTDALYAALNWITPVKSTKKRWNSLGVWQFPCMELLQSGTSNLKWISHRLWVFKDDSELIWIVFWSIHHVIPDGFQLFCFYSWICCKLACSSLTNHQHSDSHFISAKCLTLTFLLRSRCAGLEGEQLLGLAPHAICSHQFWQTE